MTLYYKYVTGYKAKVKEKKIDYQHCEECNVERIMYPQLGFYVCPSCGVCGDDIFVIGYDESTVMQRGNVFVREINIYSVENWKVLMSRTS